MSTTSGYTTFTVCIDELLTEQRSLSSKEQLRLKSNESLHWSKTWTISAIELSTALVSTPLQQSAL